MAATNFDHLPATSPFLCGPVEARFPIYEAIYNLQAGLETIKPQEEPRQYAILLTCRQIYQEASQVWRRLPQFYRSLRQNNTMTFHLLTPAIWQQLSDITITVPVTETQLAVDHRPDNHGPIISQAFVRYNDRHIVGFARLLASSKRLKRLHLIPTYWREPRKGPYDRRPGTCNDEGLKIRYGNDITFGVLALLKIFAHLPKDVKVTTQPQWERYAEEWVVAPGLSVANPSFAIFFMATFTTMRERCKGTEIVGKRRVLDEDGLLTELSAPFMGYTYEMDRLSEELRREFLD